MPLFPDFAVICLDRISDVNGGGLLTLIHYSVQFQQLPLPIKEGAIALILIKAKVAGHGLKLANISIPPSLSHHFPQMFLRLHLASPHGHHLQRNEQP